MTTESTQVTPTAEDRTAAILSYITLIGFIVAIVLHSSKPTKLGAFHLRQTLGFILIAIGGSIAVTITAFVLAFLPVIGPLLSMLLWLGITVGFFVCWIIGLIGAIQGQEKLMPVIGEPIQKWFANTFK